MIGAISQWLLPGGNFCGKSSGGGGESGYNVDAGNDRGIAMLLLSKNGK